MKMNKHYFDLAHPSNPKKMLLFLHPTQSFQSSLPLSLSISLSDFFLKCSNYRFFGLSFLISNNLIKLVDGGSTDLVLNVYCHDLILNF